MSGPANFGISLMCVAPQKFVVIFLLLKAVSCKCERVLHKTGIFCSSSHTPGNDGNASMPEQVKWPNPWRKMIIIITTTILLVFQYLYCSGMGTVMHLLWTWQFSIHIPMIMLVWQGYKHFVFLVKYSELGMLYEVVVLVLKIYYVCILYTVLHTVLSLTFFELL